LAKRANTSIDNVFKYLSKLASVKILHYIPRKHNPVVVYTEERLEDKAVQINYETYTRRKERYVEKIETMLRYASSSNKCRSQMLLTYFGETDAYRCGQCDVCQKRNELDISKYEFDAIVDECKKNLTQRPYTLQDMVERFGNRFKEENIIKVIRWLLDNGKLEYNEEEKLIWKH
jgi:ATP-dependent DNA helicase RecQ